MLKERHEIDTNHNHLHLKFSQMQSDESDRKEKVRNLKANPPIVVLFTSLEWLNVVHLNPLGIIRVSNTIKYFIRNKIITKTLEEMPLTYFEVLWKHFPCLKICKRYEVGKFF